MATGKTKNSGSRGDGNGNGDGDGRYLGELRGGGPLRTALIQGNTFAIKPVQYVEIDGLAMFEGDIVLGTVEEVEQMSDMLRAERAAGFASGVAITGAQFRWPNCRVPYTIDAALPDQGRVTDAIAHWEARTNFRFVRRTTQTDYVTFRPGSGCSAAVGRRGGQQFVNLAPGCSLGNTIHEIGHVIGLWHEQSREDRDSFVRINWAKIQPGMEHNFNQHVTDGDDIGPYDFGSIMHYPRNAFSVDGSDTITPIAAVPPGTTIGQRTSLSEGDIAASNTLCNKPVKEIAKDPIKDGRSDTIKELPTDTRKELVKDVVADTRKEQVLDTRKEQLADTIKEGAFDPPGGTLAENVVVPGGRLPGGGLAGGGLGGIAGAVPFVLATTQPSVPGLDMAADSLQQAAAQLDMQLQQLAQQLALIDAQHDALQAQYNQAAALLAQIVAQSAQSGQ